MISNAYRDQVALLLQVFTPVRMRVVEIVETEFGLSASANVISQAEMFGGKICAALDRQHPRDLFDVRLMLDNEGLTNEIRMGVIAGLLSHSRPIHEMIAPNFLDQRHVFENQFEGMAFIPFTYEDFEATRKQLVQEISESLTGSDREFLLSFKCGEPDWSLFPLKNLGLMPAVQWKLLNIQKLKAQNPEKHAEQLKKLETGLME